LEISKTTSRGSARPDMGGRELENDANDKRDAKPGTYHQIGRDIGARQAIPAIWKDIWSYRGELLETSTTLIAHCPRECESAM
jgi:hypothetical protein